MTSHPIKSPTGTAPLELVNAIGFGHAPGSPIMRQGQARKVETSGSKKGAFRFQFSRLSFPPRFRFYRVKAVSFPARFHFRLPSFPRFRPKHGNGKRSAALRQGVLSAIRLQPPEFGQLFCHSGDVPLAQAHFLGDLRATGQPVPHPLEHHVDPVSLL